MTTILQGDSRSVLKTLPDCSIQCCVTSPPYFGLRDYGVDNQIGLEETPDQYVAELVAVFREVRRVLHDSGTVWLNVGDSYARNSGTGGCGPNASVGNTRSGEQRRNCKTPDSLKEKDLCLIPWRLAIALQADGWWVRSVICWAKKSCMPESVTDRPTNSWEPIFLLAKRADYFYDAEGVKERQAEASEERARYGWNGNTEDNSGGARTGSSFKRMAESGKGMATIPTDGMRNQRNVWHLGPEPYAEAHFATFPTEIPRRAIRAGTSERGCCPKCREPWRRVTERKGGTFNPKQGKRQVAATGGAISGGTERCTLGRTNEVETRTVGWSPGCSCNAGEPIPCTVLDPFGGSGTVGEVAEVEGRNSVLIELNPAYIELIRKRTSQSGLFCNLQP